MWQAWKSTQWNIQTGICQSESNEPPSAYRIYFSTGHREKKKNIINVSGFFLVISIRDFWIC